MDNRGMRRPQLLWGLPLHHRHHHSSRCYRAAQVARDHHRLLEHPVEWAEELVKQILEDVRKMEIGKGCAADANVALIAAASAGVWSGGDRIRHINSHEVAVEAGKVDVALRRVGMGRVQQHSWVVVAPCLIGSVHQYQVEV